MHKTYQKYSHFKARVINKALEEINKFSDIEVTLIKEEKQGKKVQGFVFEIRHNKYKSKNFLKKSIFVFLLLSSQNLEANNIGFTSILEVLNNV